MLEPADDRGMASVEGNFPLIEQGATYAFSLCWGQLAVDSSGEPILDAAGLQTSAPYDLTGCTARMQFRLKQATDVLLTATSDDSDIVLSAVTPIAVTSIAVSSSVITVIAPDHGLVDGDVFQVVGAPVADGFYTVDVVADQDTFTTVQGATRDDGTEVGGSIVKCGVDNIDVLLTDELTDGLTFKSAVHDLKVYWPGGEEDYVIHGSAVVRLRITEDEAL